MCGNSEDAEEAAQDTFLALWRGIDRFRQESSLSTWIYRLASNACIDLLRRRKKQGSSLSLDDEELFFSTRSILRPVRRMPWSTARRKSSCRKGSRRCRRNTERCSFCVRSRG